MDAKKKRLLELIEELNFPIPPGEAEGGVQKLSEEDLDILIRTYEAIRSYREDLEDFLQKEDPKKYAEIMDKYYQDMEEAEKKYAEDSQKGVEEDQKLDLAEAKAEKSMDETVEEFEKGMDDVADVGNVLTSKLKTLVGEE